jgi:hypothetical protein
MCLPAGIFNVFFPFITFGLSLTIEKIKLREVVCLDQGHRTDRVLSDE